MSPHLRPTAHRGQSGQPDQPDQPGPAAALTSATVEQAAATRPLRGATLRAIRTWLSTGQASFAAVLHVPPDDITRWETQDLPVPAAVADAITGCVQASLDARTDAEARVTREYIGLTLDEFADLVQIHPRTLRRIEAGQQSVPARLHEALSQALQRASLHEELMRQYLRDLERRAPGQPLVLLVARENAALPALTRTGDPIAGVSPTSSWHRAIAFRCATAHPSVVRLAFAIPDPPGAPSPGRAQ